MLGFSKDICRVSEAFDYKGEAFSKTTGLLEDSFRKNGGFNKKSEAFSKITSLFEDIFNRIDASISRGRDASVERCGAFIYFSRLFQKK
jgi:hypothetical protein